MPAKHEPVITAVKEEIDANSGAAMDIFKMTMMVVGTVVSAYWVAGKVQQFKLSRMKAKLEKEASKS